MNGTTSNVRDEVHHSTPITITVGSSMSIHPRRLFTLKPHLRVYIMP